MTNDGNYHKVSFLCCVPPLNIRIPQYFLFSWMFFLLNLVLKDSQKISLSWNCALPWNMLFGMLISTATFDHKRQLYHIYFQSASLPLITSWRAFAEQRCLQNSNLLVVFMINLLTQNKWKLKYFPYLHLSIMIKNFTTTFMHQNIWKKGFFLQNNLYSSSSHNMWNSWHSLALAQPCISLLITVPQWFQMFFSQGPFILIKIIKDPQRNFDYVG